LLSGKKLGRLLEDEEPVHVERRQEAPEENAEAQAPEAPQTHEVRTPESLVAHPFEEDLIMAETKKVRIKVRTVNGTYSGDVLVPAMRNRVSDVFNDEERTFINLTNVTIEKTDEKASFMSLNKNMIESITLVE
jgi:hypothetical protein